MIGIKSKPPANHIILLFLFRMAEVAYSFLYLHTKNHK